MPVIKTLKNGVWTKVSSFGELATATSSLNGLMSSADKIKLDSLEEYESGINGSLSYRRRGNLVTIMVSKNYEAHSLVANQFVDVGTLPQNFRPTNDCDFWVGSMGGTAQIFGRVYATSGKVSLYTNSNTNYFEGIVTYIK